MFYFWPGRGKTAKEFVRSCDSCQRSKSSRAKAGLLQPLPVPKEPREDLTMDFIMGLPQTDRRHGAIFVFVDRLTKYVTVHLIPTTSTIGAEGAACLYIDHVFSQHGFSKTIVSDRDPRFTATFFKELFSILGTKLQMSSANHSQTDGQTERMKQMLEETLRAFVNHRQNNWDELTGVPICD